MVWRKRMLLLLSPPFVLMYGRPCISCSLIKTAGACLRKETLPSHLLIAVCDRQMNNIHSSTKGWIRQQIESSSCITEAIIMGMASMRACLQVVWDGLQQLLRTEGNMKRESLSQQLQGKHKGTHICRGREHHHSDTESPTGRKCWICPLIHIALWAHFNLEFQPELLMFRRAKFTFIQKNGNLCLCGGSLSTRSFPFPSHFV